MNDPHDSIGEFQQTTGGFSCANVLDDDVPDDAPADEADAFPIDDVSVWNVDLLLNHKMRHTKKKRLHIRLLN